MRYVEATCCQTADRPGLLEDRQALAGRLVCGLSLELGTAVLQEVSAKASGRTVNGPASDRWSRNGAGSSPRTRRGSADFGQVAGNELAVGDHDRRFIARR